MLSTHDEVEGWNSASGLNKDHATLIPVSRLVLFFYISLFCMCDCVYLFFTQPRKDERMG